MKAVLHREAPGFPVIDLFADAPAANPVASAYLLADYAVWFPADTVFLCVVDPGVGGKRPPVIVEANGRRYVGPGNGRFELVQRRAGKTRSWEIDWRPEQLSASFHGRDLFAPVAAMLARGETPPGQRCDDLGRRPDWPDDLAEIVYLDHYGNAMTGLRAAMLPSDAKLAAAGRMLERARTFSDRLPGSAFWYENSNGLADRGQRGTRGSRAWPRDRQSGRDPPLRKWLAEEGGTRWPILGNLRIELSENRVRFSGRCAPSAGTVPRLSAQRP